jgi:hypothetical protein
MRGFGNETCGQRTSHSCLCTEHIKHTKVNVLWETAVDYATRRTRFSPGGRLAIIQLHHKSKITGTDNLSPRRVCWHQTRGGSLAAHWLMFKSRAFRRHWSTLLVAPKCCIIKWEEAIIRWNLFVICNKALWSVSKSPGFLVITFTWGKESCLFFSDKLLWPEVRA